MQTWYGDAQCVACAQPGAQLYLYGGQSHQDFTRLRERLEGEGLTGADRHQLGEAEFFVLHGMGKVVTGTYLPRRRMTRLIVHEGTLPPPEEEAGEELCAPLLTQLRLSYFTDHCGMGYLLRLRDGRFILVDGGLGDYDESRLLLDTLRRQNVREKITVAAWFFTHPHNDHIESFAALMRDYPEQVEIERIAFNWPRADLTGKYSDMTGFDRAMADYTGEVHTPRSGQRYRIGGVEVDVLFACDDLYPERFDKLNDSSLVLCMTVEGRRILFTGDGQARCAAELCSRYDESVLACEMLQVPHHGYWGGSQTLFERVNPRVVLWPVPDYHYRIIRQWDCNRFFRESAAIEHIFVGGQVQAELDMTAPVRPVLREEGAVLLRPDLRAGRLASLGWAGLRGGPEGYRPPTAQFTSRGLRLTAADSRAVVELLQPGQLQGVQGITVTVCGYRSPEGTVGLWWDNPQPLLWSEEALVPLADSDGRVEARFSPDFSGRGECGLYLVLCGSWLELTEISVEKA